MPHDKTGQLLAVGDRVLIECEVAEVYTGTDYCNVQLRTIDPMFPGDNRSVITLNAKQVVKSAFQPTQPAELVGG